MAVSSTLNIQYKINEVLAALGDEQLTAKQIHVRLKDFKITPFALSMWISSRMVNRYVEKERIAIGPSFVVKFRVIAR